MKFVNKVFRANTCSDIKLHTFLPLLRDIQLRRLHVLML